ncbi:MAG: phage tail tape measure protein, partial [Muribaculaceae bacterium]|nr:phage tail tape measure protein [Muribaculaceae bacterium]
LVQAELEIQTAAIEKRYDKEISLAEGNTYKVNKLEKKKQADIAKAKNEANRKMFAMQVIQAVAQTATNAINAYGSAAAIPVVGFVMAPIAAAMAVAAGMLQIAAIKKQQQASTSQGYAKGGFTKPGAVDEPAGVVHAGEWVASQKLLANPVARPLINALDYAQRTNTIGSLRSDDVSRSITAPIVLANSQASPQVVVQQSTPTIVVEQNSEYASTMKQLAERLNEPFVTVNTITGDTGIKKAQDEYEKLMRNKTPKSKR